MKVQPSYPYDIIYSWQLWAYLIPAVLLFGYFAGEYVTALKNMQKERIYKESHAEHALEARRYAAFAWIWPLVLLWMGFRYIPMFFRWVATSTKEAKELT